MEARGYTRVRELGKGSYGSAVLVASASDAARQFVIKEVDLRRLGDDERAAAWQEARVRCACRRGDGAADALVQQHIRSSGAVPAAAAAH